MQWMPFKHSLPVQLKDVAWPKQQLLLLLDI